jgi:hypothetical protein
MADPIELSGRDPGLDVGPDEIENLGGQPTRLAHAINVGGCLDYDGHGRSGSAA